MLVYIFKFFTTLDLNSAVLITLLLTVELLHHAQNSTR